LVHRLWRKLHSVDIENAWKTTSSYMLVLLAEFC
jgi:hypothetical protein